MMRLAALSFLVPFVVTGPAVREVAQEAAIEARFEVLDEHGAPISVAEVIWVPEAAVKEWELEQRGIEHQDWFTKVQLLGKAARTDTNGQLVIPSFEDDILVIAHRDNRYWAENFNLRESPFQCPLRMVTPLRVRLTEQGGAPLAGEVALRASDGIEAWDVATAPASALDNIAHFFGADQYQEELDAGIAFTVAQVGVFRNTPEVEVDLASEQEAPIQLKGLPTGTIELAINDANGQPLRGEIEVSISAVREPGQNRVPPPPVLRITDTGKVTLPNIGLGVELEIAVKRPYAERSTLYAVEGPKKAGEVVARRVDYKEKDVVLLGRIVDEEGVPLEFDNVDVVFKVGNFLVKGEGEITIRTRADGRVQFPLVCRGRDAIQNADVRFVRKVERLSLHLEYHYAITTVTEAGIIDLGDIVMKRP
jgi:hypothetical protein